MKNSTTILISVVVGITFALALSVPAVLTGYSGIPTGQPNYSFGGMIGMMAVQGQTIQVDQAIQMMRDIPTYANVIASNNTIIFHGSQSIRLVALAIMPDGAVNLTGIHPPSYSIDDVFVVYGLINPTLVIPRGTSVQLTVVNLDDDMYHNVAISSIGPPYPYMAMQGMMISQQSQGAWISTMPFLPPANYNQGITHEYSYNLTLSSPATLWYLCVYPGHAQTGMYGKLMVT